MARSRSRDRLPDPKRSRTSYEGTPGSSSRRDRSPSPAGGSSSGRRDRDRYESSGRRRTEDYDDDSRRSERRYRDREDDYPRGDRKRSEKSSRYDDDRYRSTSGYDERDRDRGSSRRYEDDRYGSSRDKGRDRERDRTRDGDDREEKDRGMRVRDRTPSHQETTNNPVHKSNVPPAPAPPLPLPIHHNNASVISGSASPLTLPPSPSIHSSRLDSPAPATAASAGTSDSNLTPDQLKKKQTLERLEKWKKTQAAKAAAAKVGQAIAGGIAGPSGAKTTGISIASKLGVSGLPAKPAFSLPPATLARIGLPIKSNLPNKPTSGLVMDDSDASDRKLQKLNLPPVDPLVAPGGLAPDEMVSENLDVVSDDEDGDDVMDGVATAAIRSSDKMEVDGEDEEEEDPLDAFMKGNTEEVKKVNKEDEAKFGGPVTSGPRSEVLNEDDDIGDDDEPQRDGPMTAEDILALAAKKAKKKDLPVAQHGKITYEPFRKKFYVPNQETNDMDEEDVELMRVEMDGIKIRGADCPRPVRNWGAFGLPAGCYDVIKRLGYTAPTSIQAQAIPAIMSGRDIIGVAKTGSGKTIAFLLPLFRHIKDQRPLETGEGPMALIMTPTRELATQIWRESKPFLMALGMRAVCAYGGAPLSEQIGDMKKGAEVVVCTPGRMIDLLTANSGRVTNLRRCTYLVLDEADRMFDMGFEPQVMKIVNNIRPDRQTLLFSATFPAKMDALARKILIKPLEITVGGRSVVAKEITQQVEIRDADQKFLRLLEILGEMGEKHKDEEDFRTLIFVERQESADELFRELMRKGYICTSLHGGKDQVDRDQAIADFKLGYIPIVIATSVAARGLDVKELKLVINYDCPNHMEDYVHRAGRTGRAGNSGTCVTFVQSDQERYAVDIVRALKASEATVPPELEKMSEDFLVKVREGKAKAAGSGFGGKGLDKFEAERESKDRAERAFYGEDGARVEKGAGAAATTANDANKDKGKDGAAAGGTVPPDYGFDFKVEIVKGAAPDKVAPTAGGPSATKPTPATAQTTLGADVSKLPAQTLAALQRAEAAGRGGNVMENLQSAVARITASLNKTKAEKNAATQASQPAKSSDATEYHAIVPINDYPQKARWKATNKEQMVQLQELSGASITNKGIFYEVGKEPGPGQEPKLHLLIESNEEFRVKLAVDELRRILLDASVAALNDERAAPTGRYKVT